jgi:hypothetical protein
LVVSVTTQTTNNTQLKPVLHLVQMKRKAASDNDGKEEESKEVLRIGIVDAQLLPGNEFANTVKGQVPLIRQMIKTDDLNFSVTEHREFESVQAVLKFYTTFIAPGPGVAVDLLVVNVWNWIGWNRKRWSFENAIDLIAASRDENEASARLVWILLQSKEWTDRIFVTSLVVGYNLDGIQPGEVKGQFQVQAPEFKDGTDVHFPYIIFAGLHHVIRLAPIKGFLSSFFIDNFIANYSASMTSAIIASKGDYLITQASHKAFVKWLVAWHPKTKRLIAEEMKRAFATPPLSVLRTVPQIDPKDPTKRRTVTEETSPFPNAVEDEMASYLGKLKLEWRPGKW